MSNNFDTTNKIINFQEAIKKYNEKKNSINKDIFNMNKSIFFNSNEHNINCHLLSKENKIVLNINTLYKANNISIDKKNNEIIIHF